MKTKLTTSNILHIVLAVVIIILLFALIRGHQNNRQANQIAFESKRKLDSVTTASADHDKEFKNIISYANQKAVDNEKRRQDIEDSLKKANVQIKKLIAHYKENNFDKYADTSAVVVPGEYITDCKNCFIKLEQQQQLLSVYESRVHDADSSCQDVEKVLNKRITQLGTEKAALVLVAKEAINDFDQKIKSNEPRRKLLFSLGVIAINQPMINGFGLGGIYQDKMNRLFGGKIYATAYGTVYAADVSLPLSLRRRKK